MPLLVSTWPQRSRSAPKRAEFCGDSDHRAMTHMRTQDATMAMMPTEKIPMSASRLVMGTLRPSSVGIGSSKISTSVNRFIAAVKTHSLVGS